MKNGQSALKLAVKDVSSIVMRDQDLKKAAWLGKMFKAG